MSNIKQYFNIKYPFTKDNTDNILIDLNTNKISDIRSKILHVIFTPKRQRYRLPSFGTDLIPFIFGMNDNVTWDGVLNEIKTSVNTHVPLAEIINIEILESSDDKSISIQIEYSIKQGEETIITKEKIQIT